jgi:hypothetical protein
MRSPTIVWRSISARSGPVSASRLLRIASGTAIFPMSWKIAPNRSVRSASSDSPSMVPTASALSTTAREWLAV